MRAAGEHPVGHAGVTGTLAGMAVERETRPDVPPAAASTQRPPESGAGRTGRRWTGRFVAVLVALDLAAAWVAAAVARAVVGDSAPDVVTGSGWIRYTHLIVGMGPLWVGAAATAGAYSVRHVPPPGQDAARLAKASVFMLAAVALSGLVWRLEISRGFVALSLVLGFAATVGLRGLARLRLRSLRREGRYAERVLLVGRTDATRPIATHLSRDRSGLYSVVASVTPPDDWADRVDGQDEAVAQLLRAVAEHDVTTVVIGGTEAFGPHGAREVVSRLAGSGVDVLIAPEVDDFGGPRVRVRPVADLLLLEAGSNDPGAPNALGKWLVDRVGALVLLVLGSPVLLAIALAVKVTSPGPALFRQKRAGRGGVEFGMLKFRTMVRDAEERLHRDGLYDLYVEHGFKLPAEIDPRITTLGRVLRRLSLDELPQLLNVLKGEMSLVGPRPVETAQLAQYEDLAFVYTGVKPGMTGYWQVNGRSDIGFPERAELDAFYFGNRSLRLDLLILSRTVLAVLRREGAH